MKMIATAALALCGCAYEPVDYGRCLETRHIPAHTELVPRVMDPINPMRVGPLVMRQVPARDVCDRWEFPDGRSKKFQEIK